MVIVEPGRGGLLVKAGEPRELARALDSLLSRPADSREMGHAARLRVLEHFSARAVMPRLEGIYAELPRGVNRH